MYLFHPTNRNDRYEPYIYFNKLFSQEECERIIQLGVEFNDALVGPVSNPEFNLKIRKSQITWIEESADTMWLYNKIADHVVAGNSEWYRFNLSGFTEPLQLTKYEHGGHYDWHTDFGSQASSIRKLSVVIQLTDPTTYEGGNLEFMGVKGKDIERNQGDMIVFPSFEYHRVTPVTKGVRHSLVTWISGNTFV